MVNDDSYFDPISDGLKFLPKENFSDNVYNLDCGAFSSRYAMEWDAHHFMYANEVIISLFNPGGALQW